MERRTTLLSLVLTGVLVTFAGADGWGATPVPPPADHGDIVLDATVHIDSLRYQTSGSQSHVRLTGVQDCRASYNVRRINLPQHPRPGITYRNVTIVLHAAADFSKNSALVSCAQR